MVYSHESDTLLTAVPAVGTIAFARILMGGMSLAAEIRGTRNAVLPVLLTLYGNGASETDDGRLSGGVVLCVGEHKSLG